MLGFPIWLFNYELDVKQGMIDKLKLCEEYSRFLGLSYRTTYTHLTHDLVLARSVSAVKEWEEVISNFPFDGSRVGVEKAASQRAEEDLAAWFQNVDLDDGEYCKHNFIHDRGQALPKCQLSDIALYRCSWCKNPSAVLKKCGGCEAAR